MKKIKKKNHIFKWLDNKTIFTTPEGIWEPGTATRARFFSLFFFVASYLSHCGVEEGLKFLLVVELDPLRDGDIQDTFGLNRGYSGYIWSKQRIFRIYLVQTEDIQDTFCPNRGYSGHNWPKQRIFRIHLVQTEDIQDTFGLRPQFVLGTFGLNRGYSGYIWPNT